MSYVSKQIYRKIHDLIPNLQNLEPYTKFDFKQKGFPDVHLVMLEPFNDDINFILTRFKNEGRQLIADPSIEIAVNPIKKTANVLTYKDTHYFHETVLS